MGEAAEQVLNDVLASVDWWTAYKIGRQAARYGHHSKAARIFSGLTSKVSEIAVGLISYDVIVLGGISGS